MENKLVPEFRFPEYEGKWDKKELYEITHKISVGIATEVRPYVSKNPSIVIIRNQNIRAGYFDDSDLEYIVEEFDEKNKTKRVKSGDVLIVRTGSNIGNACVVPNSYENSQTFTTLIVSPQSAILNSQFLSLHINSFGLSEVKRLSAGAGKPNLNAGFLKRYRISIPTLPEQTRIASFLTAVDKRINLLQKKKAQLEQYKKGIMQKIFTVKSDGRPSLRFKDDNGKPFPNWEEKKIKDVFEVTRGYVLSVGKMKQIADKEYKYPVYSSQTRNNGLTGYFNEYLYSDAITWTTDGAHAGAVKLRSGHFYCTNVCGVLISKEGYANLCISEMLNRVTHKFVSYVGNPKLMNGVMSDIRLSFPTIPEQQKIASFLSSIDKQIENVGKQIEASQQWKKGLLQKMFV